MTKRLTSDELQVVRSQIRSPFEDGNDATVAKAFVGTIFIEVETTFLLVIEEVEIFCGKLLELPFVLSRSKACRAINPEAIGIDF